MCLVYDGVVGFDGLVNDIVVIFEVDDDDFGGRGFVFFILDVDV